MISQDDNLAREQALDYQQSFIVQAPAGSGKTELLTQRFLNLLAHVEQPENIVAITFTRKAAHEMRERVIFSLRLALENEPSEAHKKRTWQLAKQAYLQNEKQGWQLLLNHHRLRIITIDSLAAFLCRQTPLLTGIDPSTQISDDNPALYKRAVDQLFQRSDTDDNLKSAMLACLFHLDNNIPLLEQLLMDLLAKRDQWLPHVMPHFNHRKKLKEALEHYLCDVVNEAVNTTYKAFSNNQRTTLFELAQFALQHIDATHPLHTCKQSGLSLGNDAKSRDDWLAAADLLLTQKNEWRNQITKRQGFPAENKTEKHKWKQLISELDNDDNCLQALTALRLSPTPFYSANQWQILDSLITLLPMLVIELTWVFQQRKQVDFCEIGLAAERALGGEDSPTDLALYLDYKIQHLLIDEFQDTSTSQYRLITQLTREWQPNDGHSLFLVGDPMQSIYRFRQADVGLFVQTQQRGIGQLTPIPLQLSSNFRSNAELVNWFNQTFSSVFPAKANVNTGAVNYHPSQAAKDNGSKPAINAYNYDPEVNTAAECIRELIANHQQNSDESIAILIQARHQAQSIIVALREVGLECEAIDINPLSEYAEVEDAITVVRALNHPADRIAWLALLRSPIAGIALSDCLSICQHAGDNPLWSTLLNHKELILSEHAQNVLAVLTTNLQTIFCYQGRINTAAWLRMAWQQLGFNRYYHLDQHQRHVDQVFDLILHNEQNTGTIDIDNIQQRLNNTFSDVGQSHASRIQIMTIHKSKGLEFDHIYIPHTQRKPVRDSASLLLWQQHHHAGRDELILAPMKSPDQQADAIYQYCYKLEQQKLDYENRRVLYVAATRAKQSLTFIREIDQAPKGSFAAMLEPHITSFEQTLCPTSIAECETLETEFNVENQLIRMNDIQIGDSEASSMRFMPDPNVSPQLQIDTLDHHHQLQRITGTLIHQQLYRMVWLRQATIDMDNIRMQCQAAQLSADDVATVMPIIEKALTHTLRDPRGQWLMQQHKDDHCEYAIDYVDQDSIKTCIIDRTFVDQNTRWIIDYKTSTPRDGNIEHFLSNEKRQYFEQLQQYAKLINESETYPIRCALYFPLTGHWTEWSYEDQPILLE